MTTTPPARWVAARFVDAYFLHADLEKAIDYTELEAREMLVTELRAARLRQSGCTPTDEGGGDVEVRRVRRGYCETKGDQKRFHDEVVVEKGGRSTVYDVELAKFGNAWKVVRVGLESR
jgi:hypothetical protein